MLKRPSVGDTEDDILKQQEEFFKLAKKNAESEVEPLSNEGALPSNTKTNTDSIIGDIIEKNCTDSNVSHKKEVSSKGFPTLFSVSDSAGTSKGRTKKKSLFALKLQNKLSVVDQIKEGQQEQPKVQLNIESDINRENLEKLNNMGHEEILEEKKKLESTLSPEMIKFLRNRSVKNVTDDDIKCKPLEVKEQINVDEVKSNLIKCVDEQWLDMDTIEPEKLKWIGDIPDASALDSGKEFSARFDFHGNLQPFATNVDVTTALYHHGEDPERPGYTIQEMYQLCRSSVLQQRILALNTLANIIRKTKMGYYDSCFDGALLKKLVESDVFFLLRFAMDDKNTIVAAVNCLNEFFTCRSDEICLDRLRNWPMEDLEPFLFVPIETEKDTEEDELKDTIIIAQDLVKGVLRTDILVRFSYVLKNFELDSISVSKILQVLNRISRHSPEACQKVFECDNLMGCIFNNLLSSKPCYEAIKCLRILSSSSKTLAEQILRKFNFDSILKFIDMDDPAFKLKLECLAFWKTLIGYELHLEQFHNFSPCFIRLLWFYVEKVNIGHGRFDFELFAGILSVINAVLILKIPVDINYSKSLEVILEKWLTQFVNGGTLNFSNSKAIAAAMQFFTIKFKLFGVNVADKSFLQRIHNILTKCVNCHDFREICQNLSGFSHIKHYTQADRDPPNLPSLGSVYINGTSYLKIVHDNSPFPFIKSFLNFSVQLANISNEFDSNLLSLHELLMNYSNSIFNSKETPCWFSRYELGVLTSMFDVLNRENILDSVNFGFKLIPYLRTDDDKINHIFHALTKFESFKNVYHIYKNKFCNFKSIKFHICENFQRHWMYEPMAVAPTEILQFLSHTLQECANIIPQAPPTLLFCHLCIVLLDSDNIFNSHINENLEVCFNNVVKNFYHLDFNTIYLSEKTFYELYRDLVTEYASSSYGNELFAKIVTLPMAQKFDIAYRKLMWSEFIHALRVVTLPKNVANFISIDEFTTPVETDESLLILYLNALMKNVLTETRNGFVYEACIVSLNKFLALKDKDENLAKILEMRINGIKNETLKSRLLS